MGIYICMLQLSCSSHFERVRMLLSQCPRQHRRRRSTVGTSFADSLAQSLQTQVWVWDELLGRKPHSAHCRCKERFQTSKGSFFWKEKFQDAGTLGRLPVCNHMFARFYLLEQYSDKASFHYHLQACVLKLCLK